MQRHAIEVILEKDVQEVFDCFSAVFEVRILYYAPDGQEVTAGRGRPLDSTYCRLLQQHVFGADKCLRLDAEMRKRAASDGKTSYRCHAGLLEVILPIRIEGQLAGFVMMGQFRTSRELPRAVERAWERKRGIGELRAAYADLPLLPPEKSEAMLRLFEIMVRDIASRHLVALRGDLVIEDLMQYIGKHLHRRITLSEAARYVRRSPSTVSHLVKARLGKSFRSTVIEMRLERAEALFRSRPGLGVAEAARMVGYDDAFQFSAIYSKYRGEPPSAYAGRFRAATAKSPDAP